MTSMQIGCFCLCDRGNIQSAWKQIQGINNSSTRNDLDGFSVDSTMKRGKTAISRTFYL